MSTKIQIPDLGGMQSAEVIEVLVTVGDVIAKDQPIIVLEGEKATVEVPASENGVVTEVLCKAGDRLVSGQDILVIQESPKSEDTQKAKEETGSKIVDILLPDVGVATGIKIIEVLIKEGDRVAKDDSILTLESEKASLDVPSPYSGKIIEVFSKANSEIAQDDLIAKIEISGTSAEVKENNRQSPHANTPSDQKELNLLLPRDDYELIDSAANTSTHASPGVRRIAREFGVDITRVRGTGRKKRILIQDIQDYVKAKLHGGSGLPSLPKVDHGSYGEIEYLDLSNIKKATASHVHASWVNIPHVTHFDEVDITDMEEYRKKHNSNLTNGGVKLTPLVFIMKAMVKTLQEYPSFNSSLSEDGSKLILKKYYNIGIAVDTPKGLVVPVINEVDKKDITQLSKELREISGKARDKGLAVKEMQGNTFTISSLGGIGGVGFTPIVNSPDVAILGVSKSSIRPVHIDGHFIPRLILPFSLSYDHRVIDGAEAARFARNFADNLSDIKDLLD